MNSWRILSLTTFTILFLKLISPAVQAQVGMNQPEVRSVFGSPQVYDKVRSNWLPINRKDRIEWGSTIQTGANEQVVIALSDGSMIKVLPHSSVELKDNPAANALHDLLYIAYGRVLVRIHHSGSKPNPYSLNSPSASIAVRGTEFIVDVLPNGETSVSVLEGQVEVWAKSHPENRRLVTPGGRVIVRPGGEISLVFSGPGGQLNPRNRVNQDLGTAYQHSVDGLVQDSINIIPAVFAAFPDSHLDTLENPAYAAEFKDAEGRLTIMPSVSKHYNFVDDDADPRLDYAICPQLSFYTPIPGTRLTLGGSVSASRTRLQDLLDYKYTGGSYYHHDDLRFDASNFSFVTVYSFGANGRTSAGIGIDRISGTGSLLSDYRTKTDEFGDAEQGNSDVRFTRTRLTLGLFHKFSESKKLGVYFRQGISSSNLSGDYHRNYTGREYQYGDYHYSDPPVNDTFSDKTDSSTLSSEIGLRYRGQLSRRLFYGFEGSYLYERIKTRDRIEGQPLTRDRDLARRLRLGGGTGYLLNSRTIISLDFTGGRVNTSKPSMDDMFTDVTFGRTFSSSIFNPLQEHGYFYSGHGMIQVNPWRNLFVSASNLTTSYKSIVDYTYNSSTPFATASTFYHKKREMSYLTNIGIGWSFKPNLVAEYQLSLDHTNRRPSHSIMLRYTFNLNRKGEK